MVKNDTYLGIVLSNAGHFKPAIEDLCSKAIKAYHAIRKDFNFHNGTRPRVITKLFDILIAPILTYNSEVWGCFGWRRNDIRNLKRHLFNHRLTFEKLQSLMCKMVLGVKRHVSGVSAKAELGRYPLMGQIIKRIFSYWQHVIKAPTCSLLHKSIQESIAADRAGYASYYTRIKGLLFFLEIPEYIYAVPDSKTKQYSGVLRSKFNRMYEKHFFDNLEPSGKTELYHKVKKVYRYEKYLDFELAPSIRRNITFIRLSGHCLPIQYMRTRGVPRNQRLCTLCDKNKLGTELHIMVQCKNIKIVELGNHLREKLFSLVPEISKLPDQCLFELLLLANDPILSLYFAIFLKKVYEIVHSSYDKTI